MVITDKVKTALGGLAGVVLALVIATAVFFSLKWWFSPKKVSVATAAYEVELPKGIDKKDLKNLTPEKKKKLDDEIAAVLVKKAKAQSPQEVQMPVIIVYTQAGQPILPDSQTPPAPTPSTSLRASPTPTPTSTPTSTPTPTPTPSPTLTPTPTLPSYVPSITWSCSDTDGGKNYDVKGEVRTVNYYDIDKCFIAGQGEVNECSGSGCQLGEKYCGDNRVGDEPYVCPYGCQDGACRSTPPTPTPIPVCTDTDGGKDYYLKGTATTPSGTSSTDECRMVGQSGGLAECSGPNCRVFERYCIEGGGFWSEEYFCPDGCQDGACVKSSDLVFKVSQTAKDAYQQKYGADLEEEIKKIYQAAKKVFGKPFKPNEVAVNTGTFPNPFYNASDNSLVFNPGNELRKDQLVYMILGAMQDEVAANLPSNWEVGMLAVGVSEIMGQLYEPGFTYAKNDQRPFYELNNLSPAVSGVFDLIYGGFLFSDKTTMVMGALEKIYLEDNQFFAKLNEALYKEPVIDHSLVNKITGFAASVKTSVEGVAFNDWLAKAYSLQVGTPHPGKHFYLSLYLFSENHLQFYARAVEVKENGQQTGINNLPVNLVIQGMDGSLLWSKTLVTSQNDNGGMLNFGYLPDLPNYTGSAVFSLVATDFNFPSFCYPYKNGKPLLPGSSGKGIFGCFTRLPGGTNNMISSHVPGRGSFGYWTENGMFNMDDLFNLGSLNVCYVDPNMQSACKTVTKSVADYFYFVAFPGVSARSSKVTPFIPCAVDDWTDYSNEKFGFKFKIPSGWTDDSIDERQTESIAIRHLVSTTNPAEQLDAKYKLSHFDILASKTDFKTHEDYSRWFDDNTGNEKKTTVDFKGISTEKYVNETEMICSGQADENPTSCSHRFEMYYFKKGDIYYLFRIGIYTTADIKEKNEQTLNCFLENFAFADEEEIVNGMKTFISQRLNFKIKYPAELFVHEWLSDYQPKMDLGKPDTDRTMVQFFENENLNGAKITIRRDTNPERKAAWDFAKAYWYAGDSQLSHWQPGKEPIVIFTANVQGGGQEKTYFIPQDDWMYIFNASEAKLEDDLEKMMPTFEFLNPPAAPGQESGKETPDDLQQCPENLLSSEEQLKEQQENWWEKPDPCDSQPEQKVCGYIKSVYDTGQEGTGSQTFRNLCSLCRYFNKEGFRGLRGTKMYLLGYKNDVCQ